MMAFLRGHMHAFAYLGGVPEPLLHDHQKTVVHAYDPGGAHRWNTRYLDVADHDGFVPRLCRPYRAHTKGKVESRITDIRRNFWPSCPDVPALDALHEALGSWLAEVANVRMHGTTHEGPLVRWAQERLRPVNIAPYDLSLVSTRGSRTDGFIS
jgi:transposase